jgi:hypothetical protein
MGFVTVLSSSVRGERRGAASRGMSRRPLLRRPVSAPSFDQFN